MTTFNLSRETAKEISENLYRDYYREPIKFRSEDNSNGQGTHCYYFADKSSKRSKGNKDMSYNSLY